MKKELFICLWILLSAQISVESEASAEVFSEKDFERVASEVCRCFEPLLSLTKSKTEKSDKEHDLKIQNEQVNASTCMDQLQRKYPVPQDKEQMQRALLKVCPGLSRFNNSALKE